MFKNSKNISFLQQYNKSYELVKWRKCNSYIFLFTTGSVFGQSYMKPGEEMKKTPESMKLVWLKHGKYRSALQHKLNLTSKGKTIQYISEPKNVPLFFKQLCKIQIFNFKFCPSIQENIFYCHRDNVEKLQKSFCQEQLVLSLQSLVSALVFRLSCLSNKEFYRFLFTPIFSEYVITVTISKLLVKCDKQIFCSFKASVDQVFRIGKNIKNSVITNILREFNIKNNKL